MRDIVCDLDTRNPKLETRNLKPETQTPKSEARGPPRWICEIMPAHSTAETRDPKPNKAEKRKPRSSLEAYHPANAGGGLHDAAAEREGNDLQHFNHLKGNDLQHFNS